MPAPSDPRIAAWQGELLRSGRVVIRRVLRPTYRALAAAAVMTAVSVATLLLRPDDSPYPVYSPATVTFAGVVGTLLFGWSTVRQALALRRGRSVEVTPEGITAPGVLQVRWPEVVHVRVRTARRLPAIEMRLRDQQAQFAAFSRVGRSSERLRRRLIGYNAATGGPDIRLPYPLDVDPVALRAWLETFVAGAAASAPAGPGRVVAQGMSPPTPWAAVPAPVDTPADSAPPRDGAVE